MSGTSRIKPPKTEAEFGRSIHRRLEGVENPTAVRCGAWVLSTSDEDGSLIASHADGGSVLLARRPEPTQEPDAVDAGDDSIPAFTASMTVLNANRGDSVTIAKWDAVTHNVGNWETQDVGVYTSQSANGVQWFRIVVVPEDGLYHVRFTVPWNDDSQDIRKAMLLHRAADHRDDENNGTRNNWTIVQADERRPGNNRPYIITHSLSDVYPLKAGDSFRVDMYTAGSTLLDAYYGFSKNDPATYASISLVKVG